MAAWTNGQAAVLALGAADLTTAGTGVSASRFAGPADICSDAATGKVFVVVLNQNRILRFSSAAAITSDGSAEAVLGQPDFTSTLSNNGGRYDNSLSAPTTCAMDAAGRLFVADSGNRRVLRFDNASSKVTFAGADAVFGQVNFYSSATGTSASTFGDGDLNGIAVGANGSLYVADSGNRRILRFDNAATKASGAAADGVLGAASFTAVGAGEITATTVSSRVLGLAVDASGNLFVSDAGNRRILRFNSAASKANGAAADGVLGAADLATAGAGAASQSNFSNLVYGIEVLADGALYVADYSFNRVLVFNSPAAKANGANADAVLGQLDYTATAGATTAFGLKNPMGLGVVPNNGYLMITDAGNNRAVGIYNPALVAITATAATATVSTGGSGVNLTGGTITLTDNRSSGTVLSLGSSASTNVIYLPSGDMITVNGSNARLFVTQLTFNGRSLYALGLLSGSAIFSTSESSQFIGVANNQLITSVNATSSVTVTSDNSSTDASLKGQTLHVNNGSIRLSSLASVANSTTSTAAAGIVYAGETATINASGQVTAAWIGSANHDQHVAGDPPTTPTLPWLTLAYGSPILDSTSMRLGRTPESDMLAALSQLGLTRQGVRSNFGEYLLSKDGRTYSAMPVGRVVVDVGLATADGFTFPGNGDLAFTKDGVTVTLAPCVADVAALAQFVSLLGGTITVQADGSYLVSLGDQRLAMQAGFDVIPNAGAAGVGFDALGNLVYTDAKGRQQMLYPVAADFATLASEVRKIDATATIRGNGDGSLTMRFPTQTFTLMPNYSLIPIPADHAGDAWWIGADGLLYLKVLTLAGYAQGFLMH